MKTKASNTFLEIVGFILLDLSLILAYVYQSKHFYEILVLGLFLILYGLDRRYIFFPSYLRLYKKFIKAGIIGDLIFGLTLTKLWHYNYTSLWAYLSLYLIVYPVAGMVMVQTFVLVKRVFLKRERRRSVLSAQFYKNMMSAMIAANVCLVVAILYSHGNHTLISFFFLTVMLYALVVISYATMLHGHLTILDELHNYPYRFTAIIIAATYFNAFFHELPNTTAHQWVYTNWPLGNNQILGIPIVVLLVWPFLTLYPAAAYYYLTSKTVIRPSGTRKQRNSRPRRLVLTAGATRR